MRKDAKQLADLARALGWRDLCVDSRGHLVMAHEDSPTELTIALSPNQRSIRNTRRDVYRLIGLREPQSTVRRSAEDRKADAEAVRRRESLTRAAQRQARERATARKNNDEMRERTRRAVINRMGELAEIERLMQPG